MRLLSSREHENGARRKPFFVTRLSFGFFRQWNSPSRARRAIFIAYLVPAAFYCPYALKRYEVGVRERADGTLQVSMEENAIEVK